MRGSEFEHTNYYYWATLPAVVRPQTFAEGKTGSGRGVEGVSKTFVCGQIEASQSERLVHRLNIRINVDFCLRSVGAAVSVMCRFYIFLPFM